MEEDNKEKDNKIIDIIKFFARRHLKTIIIIFAAALIIFATAYVIMNWIANTVTNAARAFTSKINISNSGTMSTDISAKDLWNQMLEQGYDVDQYLDNPTELSKLLQAELVTRLPDTRSNVETPIDWNAIFSDDSSTKGTSEGDTLNVLFIGNSKTFVNELASLFQDLSKSTGKKVYAVRTKEKWGGRTLKDFLNEDGPSNDLKERLKEKKWDYIVLQEQTDSSLIASELSEGATGITKLVRETNNPKAKVIYAAWSVMGDYNEDDYNNAARNCELAKAETGGAVAYIGAGLLKYHEAYPSVNLFPDGLHASKEGTSLAACCVYNAIFGEKTEGSPETFGFSKETADAIKKAADEAQEENGGTTAGEVVQGIIKFLRHDENGNQKYLTYASEKEFNSWVNEYKSSGSESAKQKALSHFTLKKTKKANTNKGTVANGKMGDVIEAAKSQLGKPYNDVYSAAEPDGDGFNCSGLVWWAYEQAGYTVDHAQCADGEVAPNRGMIDTVYANCGKLLKNESELNAGDVLFYDTNDGRESGHVALYMGNGQSIQSVPNGGVSIDDNPFDSGFIGGGPLIVNDTSTSTSSNTSTTISSGVQGELDYSVSGDGYAAVYTSSSGLTYRDYKQYEGSYAGDSYRGDSICNMGCLPTSMAIIASGLGRDDLTPGVIASKIDGEFFTNAINYMNELGWNPERLDGPSADEVVDKIKKGNALIVYADAGSAISWGNHYSAVVDVNSNGEVFVINPGISDDDTRYAAGRWLSAESLAAPGYSFFAWAIDTGKVGVSNASSEKQDNSLGYQAVIATWTQVDKSTELYDSPHASEATANLGVSIENGTTYSMTTKTIDYESMVQPYTLSFDLLWTFLVLGQTKGFVMDWSDLAYGSEIEVSIYDNLTTTTDIDDWHYVEETDVKISGYVNYNLDDGKSRFRRVDHDHIYANGDRSVKQQNGQITKTVVTHNNTVVAELTKAHTWIADYDVNYTYSKDGGNAQNGQQSRDGYTVVDWTNGGIDDDPCGEIQNKINEVVESVNEYYQEIADRKNAIFRAEYLDSIAAVGDQGQIVEVYEPTTITASDVNTSEVNILKQVNHVDIVDNTTDIVVTQKYTAGVPKLTFNDSEASATTAGSNGSELVGDNLEEKVWWALLDAGYSKETAAGVMGNVYAESGFNAGSTESGLSYDEVMNNPNLGLGICGWTYDPLKREFINYAKSCGKPWTDEDVQVRFLVACMKPGGESGITSKQWANPTHGCSYNGLINASNPEDAAYQYCWVFENPDESLAHIDVRKSKAREYYDKYKDSEEPAGKIVENLDNFLFIGDSRYAEGGTINSAIKAAGKNITVKGVGSSSIEEWLAVANNGGRGTVKGESVSLTGNYSGISIQLGANSVLNNVDGAASQMQSFITKLKGMNKGVPIFVNSCLGVNSNATSSGYKWDVSTMQNCIDSFNNKVKAFCDSTDGVYYIDISTGLMDSSGFVKLEYESDGLHMSNPEGAAIFVDNIKNGALGKSADSKKRLKSGRENFVTLFNKAKYSDNRNSILSATDWLFEIMRQNDKLANMVDIIKYLLYRATGIDFGATDIEQIWQEYLNSFKSIDSSGGKSGISGVPGQIYDFLLAKGMPPVGAAAVLGNIENESGFQPGVVNSIGASGLCQWYKGRFDNLKNLAASRGTDWTDVNTQMEYLWKELNESYPKVKEVLMSAKSESDLEYATWYWGSHFEVYDLAADAGFEASKNWAEEKERYEAAKHWYSEWQIHHTSGGGNSDVVNFALQFEGKRQTEIPGFLGCTLSDGSVTIFQNHWCMMFASWCFDQCGLIPSKLPQGGTIVNDDVAQQYGKFRSGGSYVPNPGDLIYFNYNGGGTDHVAIVVSCNGNSVEYIGGNQGGIGDDDYTFYTTSTVSRHTISLSDGTLAGFWDMSN